MGKPQEVEPAPSPIPSHMGETSSAISLDTTSSELPIQRYFDDDPVEAENDDVLPLYSDIEPEDGSQAAPIDPLMPPGVQFAIAPLYKGPDATTNYYLDRRLDTDPVFLKQQIEAFATIPPRPFVQIVGKHLETVKRSGKDENKEIVDFDIQVELTPLLYYDIRSRRSCRQLGTVGSFEKVKRGTVFATRAPGYGGRGVPEETVPTVDEWCHRYCASHAGLKKFVLTRRVTGWDWDLMRSKLQNLVRSTNYRGSVDISFPVKNQSIQIYNECRTNRWRLTRWVELLFYFTMLWLFTWPWLFFRTKTYETVHVVWPMSLGDGSGRRYISMSEEQWYNMWARPIQRAILGRHQGQLDQSHLTAVDDPQRAEGLAGFMQAGVEAMGVVNRSFGWGGDY